MNRSIVTIEPALAGWVVSFEGQALQVLPSKLEAIGFASRRAAEQHRTSGTPCGVSVRLRPGETVPVALHGWEGPTVRGSLSCHAVKAWHIRYLRDAGKPTRGGLSGYTTNICTVTVKGSVEPPPST